MRKDKNVNIEHGISYCSNCGTELPSGPPCSNHNCKLAVIKPMKKNKIIANTQIDKTKNNIQKSIVSNNKLDHDQNYIDQQREIAAQKIIKKYYNNKSNLGLGFWNGTEGLAKSFWLYFIRGNSVGNILSLIVASKGSGMLMFALLIIIIWNIFAVMAVFNAAEIYKKDKIKLGQSYGYATAAKVASILLILSGIGSAL